MNTSIQAEIFKSKVQDALETHPTLTTLKDLADSLGFHRNTISRAVNYYRFPRIRKAIRRKLRISA